MKLIDTELLNERPIVFPDGTLLAYRKLNEPVIVYCNEGIAYFVYPNEIKHVIDIRLSERNYYLPENDMERRILQDKYDRYRNKYEDN